MKNKAVGIGEVVPNVMGNCVKRSTFEDVMWAVDCFVISDSLLEKFNHIYPHFHKELLKAELWYLANPKRRKKNHFRYLANWMSRQK